MISSELINADGSIVVQQGEYLGSDCIFLPVTQDQTIQVIGNSEILSDATEKIPARVENTSNISTTGFLICSDPSSSISLTSEANLQNDVMLGQIIAGATKGSDDDDLVGELRNFLPKRNESMSDIANDIPEYGMDWNGGELVRSFVGPSDEVIQCWHQQDWSLEQSAVNEGVQTSEADKLNEEFSKRMREEFAASFIKLVDWCKYQFLLAISTDLFQLPQQKLTHRVEEKDWECKVSWEERQRIRRRKQGEEFEQG